MTIGRFLQSCLLGVTIPMSTIVAQDAALALAPGESIRISSKVLRLENHAGYFERRTADSLFMNGRGFAIARVDRVDVPRVVMKSGSGVRHVVGAIGGIVLGGLAGAVIGYGADGANFGYGVILGVPAGAAIGLLTSIGTGLRKRPGRAWVRVY